MAHYEHRQPGTLTLAALLFGLAVVAALFVFVPESRFATGPAFVLLLLGVWLFHALSVEVSGRELSVWFGPGLIRRTFPLEEIADARPVRNRWYYGWGVRLIPGGWMFNVSGLDAVELELADGRLFRIGTDEPRRLAEAIGDALRRRGSGRRPPATDPGP